MIMEEMLNCENPANLNAIMFSRHFLDCNIVFVKIRSVLLFEVSPVQIANRFQITDSRMIGELYKQFVTINPFMLQVMQILISNKIQVIPYEYENEYLSNDKWDKMIIETGYPKLDPAIVFPTDPMNREKLFFRYVEEGEKVGFISIKPLSLAKSYRYPFRVFPNLLKMEYSYQAPISNKRFKLLYESFVNQSLLPGVNPKTKAYTYGFAKLGPLHFMLCKMIYEKIIVEKFDRVYFMPRAYLLFMCFQNLYSSQHYAAMLEEGMEGSKVLVVDFGKDNSILKELCNNNKIVATGKGIEFFKWKVLKKYRKSFIEMKQLLSKMPFSLLDCVNASYQYLPYPTLQLENKILSDIYKGVVEFVEKFHQFVPECLEEKLGPFYLKYGFEIYMQETHKNKFSLYDWLKKNKLVRRVYSNLKRRLSGL